MAPPAQAELIFKTIKSFDFWCATLLKPNQIIQFLGYVKENQWQTISNWLLILVLDAPTYYRSTIVVLSEAITKGFIIFSVTTEIFLICF